MALSHQRRTSLPWTRFMKLLGVFLCLTHNPVWGAEVMTLDGVLDLALKSSPRAQTWQLDKDAADRDIASRELALSPTLAADGSVARDRRDSFGKGSSNYGNVSTVDSSLVVPFATGTTASLLATHQSLELPDAHGNRNAANWEVRLSQDILRNGFGRSTRLRRENDSIDLKIQRLGILRDRLTYLIEVENAYWDLLVASKESAVYQKNLTRRQALENWMRGRISQFAAESHDLIQVQTLLSQLRLGLADIENKRAAAQMRLKQLIPGVEPSAWVLDHDALTKERRESSLVAIAGEGTPTRIDALVLALQAKQGKTSSLSLEDSLKPSLAPYVSYGASGIEPQLGRAWGNASTGQKNVVRVGVSLAMELDGHLKNERLAASRMTAESQSLKSELLTRESELAWEELRRRISFLKAQSLAAQQLAELQSRKVNAERSRFEQGRTTTLQMTTFEVDAAESELRHYEVLSELRKTESAARHFVYEGTLEL